MDIDDSMERLATALVDVADVDLDALCDEQLDALLTSLVRFTHRVQAVASRVAARWDARSIWTSDGSRSAASRLARDTSSSRQAVGATLRRGRALATMPATAAAVAEGSISTDHVDLLVAAGRGREEVFARDEATLVDSMRGLRFDQCAKAVSYWRQRADEEIGLDEPPLDVSSSTMTISNGVGHETQLVAHLDPVDAAQVTAAIDILVGELRRNDRDAGRSERSLPQLRGAALVEMARRAMSAPSGIARTRPLLTIVCGDERFARLCELSTGRVVSPGDLVPHLDELDVRTILFEGPQRPIAASPRRTFGGTLRQAIVARDRHCQHRSGCDEPIDRCDIDHVIPWRRGGTTCVDNGRLLCRYHNRIEASGTRPPVHVEPVVGRPNAPPLTA